jgi:uncharacterized repeat protein (TIGR03803 family)
LLAICALLIGAAPVWAASREKVIYSFTGTDGSCPSSNLIFDAEGNLYGTTLSDGIGDCHTGKGTVFKLSPANGKWTKLCCIIFTATTGLIPLPV